jgi:hypothetical protein
LVIEVLVLNQSDSRYDTAAGFQKTLRCERSLNSRFFSLGVNGAAYLLAWDDDVPEETEAGDVPSGDSIAEQRQE